MAGGNFEFFLLFFDWGIKMFFYLLFFQFFVWLELFIFIEKLDICI
jgi:hypothetical protein